MQVLNVKLALRVEAEDLELILEKFTDPVRPLRCACFCPCG